MDDEDMLEDDDGSELDDDQHMNAETFDVGDFLRDDLFPTDAKLYDAASETDAQDIMDDIGRSTGLYILDSAPVPASIDPLYNASSIRQALSRLRRYSERGASPDLERPPLARSLSAPVEVARKRDKPGRDKTGWLCGQRSVSGPEVLQLSTKYLSSEQRCR